MGCDAHNEGGNNSAGIDRVRNWSLLGALLGALAMLATVFGVLGWVALAAILAAAVGGGILGFFVGSAIDWFNRLKEQTPRTITMQGIALCAARNPFGVQPISDGDWTCNLGFLSFLYPPDLPVTAPGATSQLDEVRLRAAPGSGLDHAFPSFNEDAHIHPILHCEISAKAGAYSVVGGAVGSGLGTAAGVAAGIAACIAAGIFSFGIGLAICALIVALFAAAGAAAGGAAGAVAGAFVGWVVDELSDFDKLGKTIESNQRCLLNLTGRWVTDTSHEHNEIHDIESVQIVKCPTDGTTPIKNFGAVIGIGRQPTGDQAPIK
jgi:hypothetical protein